VSQDVARYRLRRLVSRVGRWVPGASRLRRSPRTGKRLRLAGAQRLTDAGFASFAHEAVIVDHAHRSVVRATTADGDEMFVKLDANRARVAREMAAITWATQHGLPAPAIRWSDIGDPAVLVLDAVPGEPLHQTMSDRMWTEAAATLRRVHEIDAPAGLGGSGTLDSWRDRCRQQAVEAVDAIKARGLLAASEAGPVLQQLDQRLGALPNTPARFLHGDCMAKHVLVTDSEIGGVIDWAEAGGGDPLWDVAVLTMFARDRLPAFLAGYGVPDDALDEVLTVVGAYWDLRTAKAAHWSFEHGYDPDRYVRALRLTLEGDQAR
jgi:aminoglycoside phosphotransferase (APT) family kinase protein